MWNSHLCYKINTNQRKSVLWSLRSRETNGIGHKKCVNSRHHVTATSRMFSSIPKRLAFSLKELVDEHVLIEEAHVFLGFNSDGTYVISYTESFGAMDQTGLPSYVYRLHWWLFRFNKKMHKVYSVRLFSNEEITSSLQLYYAEWPCDKTKVLIYGCCKDFENCYITVSAVPRKVPCSQCNALKTFDYDDVNRCFKHGFVAHMKHSSVSSSSAVLNASGLQVDGLIVLNMGHSIGVISLGLTSEYKSIDNFPLSSIKLATFEEKPTSSEADDFLNPSIFEKSSQVLSTACSNKNSLYMSGLVEAEKDCKEQFNSFIFSSDSQMSNVSTQSEASGIKDWDMTSSSPNELSQPISCISLSETSSIVEHCTCPFKANETNNLYKKDDQPGIDPYFDPEPKSIVLVQRGCENIYTNPVVSNSEDKKEAFTKNNGIVEKSENCCCGYSENSRCSVHNFVTVSNRLPNRFVNHKPSVSKKPLELINFSQPNKQPVKSYTNTCTYCGLRIKEHRLNSKKKELLSNAVTAPARNSHIGSPARNSSKLIVLPSHRNTRDSQDYALELNAPTPSPSASESSGSVYCTGDNNSQASYKSGNCRKTDGIISFYETLYERQGTLDLMTRNDYSAVATENSLFYGPVTFESASGVPLHPIISDTSSSVAFSQHLVLDIEHVIFDVLRTRCYTTYKFGYLIDYDVQIIDTCSNTRSVVILIVALLNVAPRKTKTKWQEHHYRTNETIDSNSSKSQQFQFFICWQLQTGRYEVVAASPLQVFDRKKSGKWDATWVLQTRHTIRKACAIPQLSHCAVYVLSNSSVFRGKSLDYLWDIERVIALKR